MPFQNLRVNNQFYILHKDGTPFVETGSVVGVSAPVPEAAQQPMMFGQPMRMVVDITVKGGRTDRHFSEDTRRRGYRGCQFPRRRKHGYLRITGVNEFRGHGNEDQIPGNTQEHRLSPHGGGIMQPDDGNSQSRTSRKAAAGCGE